MPFDRKTVWQFYPIDGQRYKDSDGVVPYRFDGYQELDEAEQSEVDSYTQKIRSQISDMLKNVLEIGKHLCEVQTLLANHHKGTFVSWLETDFGWSFRSAYYLISVYERFGSFANFAELPIGQSALYLLAADSTPEQARDEAIQRAEDGEAITNKTAKEIVGRHREIIVQTTSDSVGAEDEVEWSESEKERRAVVEMGQTVVANLHKGEDEALRAWATEKGLAVRIDRKSRSDWENPFVVDADGTREEVIEHYKWYYERKRSLKRQIKTLRGKVLLCWCHPEPCHGDFLAEEAMDIPELF